MAIEHYNQPDPVFFILEVCNAFFTTVFGLGKILVKNNIKSYTNGPIQHDLNSNIIVFFSYRSFSENYRSKVPLFHRSLECFRFFVGPSIRSWYTYGRHYDRFSSITDTAESRSRVQDR